MDYYITKNLEKMPMNIPSDLFTYLGHPNLLCMDFLKDTELTFTSLVDGAAKLFQFNENDYVMWDKTKIELN